MKGTEPRRVGRSVQLAVMATPTTTLMNAVIEARRKQATHAASAERRPHSLVAVAA